MSQDNQLQKNVMAELNWEPSIVAAHIGVMANDGVVTLTGHVTSFAEKYAAERAASRVKGVKAVAEEIEVKLPFDSKREDDEIAAAALERLAWDTFVPKDVRDVVGDVQEALVNNPQVGTVLVAWHSACLHRQSTWQQ